MSETKLEPYKSLCREASAVFVEKKSEFIGYAAPVSTEEDAIAFIEKIRKKHADGVLFALFRLSFLIKTVDLPCGEARPA